MAKLVRVIDKIKPGTYRDASVAVVPADQLRDGGMRLEVSLPNGRTIFVLMSYEEMFQFHDDVWDCMVAHSYSGAGSADVFETAEGVA